MAVRVACGFSCTQLIPRTFQNIEWYRIAVKAARGVCSIWNTTDITVIFVDGKKMRAINKAYRGQDRITDVLSFLYPADMPGETAYGELYLCPEQIVRQSVRYGSARGAEYERVIVHGILHIQGYDHITSPDRRRMNQLSSKILALLGKSGKRAV